jgi:hypothetical protein
MILVHLYTKDDLLCSAVLGQSYWNHRVFSAITDLLGGWSAENSKGSCRYEEGEFGNELHSNGEKSI